MHYDPPLNFNLGALENPDLKSSGNGGNSEAGR